MRIIQALIFVMFGSILLIASIATEVPHPGIGIAIGGIMVVIGACPLARRWPKPEPDDSDEAGC